jgi:hypothetical protein
VIVEIAKFALVAFLVIGVAVLTISFIRKSREKGFPTPESSSQFWQIKGAMPPTPKPHWVEQDSKAEDERPRD